MKPFLAFLLSAAVLSALLPVTEAGEEEMLKPTNLGAVNTKADEDDPFVTPNGLMLFYASKAGATFELLLSPRTSALGKWKAGRSIEDVNVKDADVRSPFLTRDGRFFFASNKVPDEKLKDLKNFDIFDRTGGREPTPLLKVDTVEDELFPWVTAAGKEFFFSRKTRDGWRLYVARGPFYGAIGEGKLIEGLAADFHHATLTPDGLTMYLQGPLEKDRWGLFRTTRKKVGAEWEKPEPLTALNSSQGERGDMSPCVSGTTLYFASDRPGGQGGLDLWSIPIAKLKKKK
jgi:hypothetical protein